MTKDELQKELQLKGFVFVNRLVTAIGGSKKGGKVQDILEILEAYDTNAEKVVDAYYVVQHARKQRIANFLGIVDEIKDTWDEVADYVINSEKTPENVSNAVEKIDSIVEYFFRLKK